MLATCICLNVSLLDQLCCTIFNLFAVYLYIRSNKYVCLSVCLSEVMGAIQVLRNVFSWKLDPS